MPQETPGNPRETPLETLSDRDLLLRIARVADHLDPMIHEIHNWAGQAAPLLERVGGIGRGFRKAGRHG